MLPAFAEELARCENLSDRDRLHVVVIGPPGSGKTVLGTALARVAEAAFVSMDELTASCIPPGATERDPVAEQAAVRDCLKRPRLVTEGLFPRTAGLRIAAADVVILCEPSPWRCRYSVFKRGLRNLLGLKSTIGSLAKADFPTRLEHVIGSRLYRQIQRYWTVRRKRLHDVLIKAREYDKIILVSQSYTQNDAIFDAFEASFSKTRTGNT